MYLDCKFREGKVLVKSVPRTLCKNDSVHVFTIQAGTRRLSIVCENNRIVFVCKLIFYASSEPAFTEFTTVREMLPVTSMLLALRDKNVNEYVN